MSEQTNQQMPVPGGRARLDSAWQMSAQDPGCEAAAAAL